jgi:hypothetical protein
MQTFILGWCGDESSIHFTLQALPQEKVWYFKSGKHDDQERSPNREIKRPGKISLKESHSFLAMWALIPL